MYYNFFTTILKGKFMSGDKIDSVQNAHAQEETVFEESNNSEGEKISDDGYDVIVVSEGLGSVARSLLKQKRDSL
jgi:hypothetical protein